jgi:hypothetical protein
MKNHIAELAGSVAAIALEDRLRLPPPLPAADLPRVAKSPTAIGIAETAPASVGAVPAGAADRQHRGGVPSGPPWHNRLWSDRDLEAYTGRSRSCWQKDRVSGRGPPFVKVGRLVRYNPAVVIPWLERHTFASTTEADAASAAEK